MRKFTIKDLERFSLLKAHSIRTWEKRYHILAPQRNVVNIRYYTLSDVEKLLDISLLVTYGLRISQIAKMTPENIETTFGSITSEEIIISRVINKLIVFMHSAEIEEFEIILDYSIKTWGIDKAIKGIIIPFLERVQILSYKDSSIEAHFVVTVIRKKLITGIENIPRYSKQSKTVLLFLPKGEHYDLMLLYMTYIIKAYGLNTLYLGTNISKGNLELVLRNKTPHYLYTYVPSIQSFNLSGYAEFFKAFPELTLFVATSNNKEPVQSAHKNIHVFSYKDLEGVLSKYSSE